MKRLILHGGGGNCARWRHAIAMPRPHPWVPNETKIHDEANAIGRHAASPLTRTDPLVPSKTDPASRTRFRSRSTIWIGERIVGRAEARQTPEATRRAGRSLRGRLAFGARARRCGRCGSGGASG
jgi:hypothetical protein